MKKITTKQKLIGITLINIILVSIWIGHTKNPKNKKNLDNSENKHKLEKYFKTTYEKEKIN